MSGKKADGWEDAGGGEQRRVKRSLKGMQEWEEKEKQLSYQYHNIKIRLVCYNWIQVT